MSEAEQETSEFAVPLDRTLDGMLGLEIDSYGDGRAEGHFEVTDRVRQRWGIVHGGAYAALAEVLASEGTNHHVRERGEAGVGLSNHTSFLRPVSDGVVRATAIARHRGRRTWVWEVEIVDERSRACAVSRVTIAIVPAQRD
jgi:1,4-dihydroxy-2-naphthoyl-CoA hydrolase